MRSSILISKISRLIETSGESGGGAALAREYAAAVNKANERLEAVIAAIDSKSISDAVRLLSEDPPLLEEVSVLDFFQLQDWINLCDMNNWKVPPKIDKQMMERAIEIGERKDAIAPFLSMYKKAIRVNNVRLAVKSLRRLAELDHSQDWTRNLKQSEKQLQVLIIEEFRKAKKTDDAEKCEQLTQELLDDPWVEGLLADGVEEVKAYRQKCEAEEREAKGKENIEILKKCREGKWDRKKVSSLLQSLDNLSEKGWKVPEADQEVVTGCRVKCAQEVEQEEKERRWREVNEELHAAIQKEDCEAIRAALSEPEFLDRDPIEDMLRQAQEILGHAEAARRRKTLQIVVVSLLAVLAIVGVSGWWLRQKVFVGRCADEVSKLTYLEKQAKEKPRASIQGLSTRLAKLKAEEPEIYNDPKVNQFEARLKAIILENESRTNEIVLALKALEDMHARGWLGGMENPSITNRINRINALLTKDDSEYRIRFLTIKNALLDAAEKKEQVARSRATKFHATLVSHLKTITARLKNELARKELLREVVNCVDSLKEWKRVHSQFAEELEAELATVERNFNEALADQSAYTNALEKLVQASDAISTLNARKDLIEHYGNYPEVKKLKPLAVSEYEIKDVLSPQPAAVKAYLDKMKGGISEKEFETFLQESVAPIAETSYYSLYGITGKGDPLLKVIAISQGKPTVEKPSYETVYKISSEKGSILSFKEKRMLPEIKNSKMVEAFLMPSSAELRKVVALSQRSDLTVAEFESEILRLIKAHLDVAQDSNYIKNQEKFVKQDYPFKDGRVGWYSPYRRVQFLSLYMRWLKEELKLMPVNHEITKWYDELKRLAQPIIIDDVDEELTWICLWDTSVKERTRECARLLNKIPSDWTVTYQQNKRAKRAFTKIGGWKVLYAGKVKFDPRDPTYLKDPEEIYVAVPGVKEDHPLYVLRKVDGQVKLVRAFEMGKEKQWRKCRAVENTNEGYIFAEPLYHVRSKEAFIDVEEELQAIEKQFNIGKQPRVSAKDVPLFSSERN